MSEILWGLFLGGTWWFCLWVGSCYGRDQQRADDALDRLSNEADS